MSLIIIIGRAGHIVIFVARAARVLNPFNPHSAHLRPENHTANVYTAISRAPFVIAPQTGRAEKTQNTRFEDSSQTHYIGLGHSHSCARPPLTPPISDPRPPH